MDTKIDKRGGPRPNSGRPRIEEKRKQVCIYLKPVFADRLKEMAKEKEISTGRLVERWIRSEMFREHGTGMEKKMICCAEEGFDMHLRISLDDDVKEGTPYIVTYRKKKED